MRYTLYELTNPQSYCGETKVVLVDAPRSANKFPPRCWRYHGDYLRRPHERHIDDQFPLLDHPPHQKFPLDPPPQPISPRLNRLHEVVAPSAPINPTFTILKPKHRITRAPTSCVADLRFENYTSHAHR